MNILGLFLLQVLESYSNLSKSFKYLLGLFIFGIGYYYFCQFRPGLPGYHYFYYTPEKYLAEQEKVKENKTLLIREWKHDKITLLEKAAHLFQEDIDGKLIPYWLGTNYDFYGKTYIPGQGEIACGYLVTTLLEDMGVQLKRNRLAQLASESMIKELVKEKYIKRYSNQALGRVISDIEFNGKGLYVIGLDTHTGFLLNDGNNVYFIHASGRRPWQVVEEYAESSPVLIESKYRVTACLTCDPSFIDNWLNQ